MASDGGRQGRVVYSAKVEDFEIVEKVRENSGVLAQGTDMLLAYAGSIVGQGQYALFTIRVFCDGGTSTIKKRFSEFSALHAEILKNFPGGLDFDLPDKGLVRQFSEQAMRDRMQLLNVYLKALCSRPEAARHPAALAFFRVGSGVGSGVGAARRPGVGSGGGVLASDPVPVDNYDEADPFAPTFMGGQTNGHGVGIPIPQTMSNGDGPHNVGAVSSFTAQIERFDVVGATSANEGVLGQGLDMLFSAAGSLTGSGGTYVVYTVKVQSEGQYSSLKKRFSEFEKLHTELQRAFPGSLGFELPDKGVVRQFSNEALADRARALNAYLKALCAQREMAQHPATLAFLGLGGGAGGAATPARGGAYATSAIPEPVPNRAGAAINGRSTAAVPSGRQPDDDDDLAGWDTPSL